MKVKITWLYSSVMSAKNKQDQLRMQNLKEHILKNTCAPTFLLVSSVPSTYPINELT